MRYIIFFIILIFSYTAKAVDPNYTNQVSDISINSKLANANLPLPYLSRLSVQKNPASINNSSGLSIMSSPGNVNSGYDSAISYDVSDFYRLNKPRLQTALAVPSSLPGEYFMIGLDSGVSSQKLKIGNGLFLGYTNTIDLNQDTFFNYSFGSWFGGKVKETPCYDSYDRAYACKSLTAWSDYKPDYPTQYSYINIKAVKYF